jgi:hypothetical protein
MSLETAKRVLRIEAQAIQDVLARLVAAVAHRIEHMAGVRVTRRGRGSRMRTDCWSAA